MSYRQITALFSKLSYLRDDVFVKNQHIVDYTQNKRNQLLHQCVTAIML